ncbi:hypothetical protein ACF0HT_13545 (plasmid) [Staphylococcus xylosus]|uniref:hypothetical protein n=1 Tax=Staphylococcus xylosus TaxID=1288 RepID=UPI0037499279
MLLKNKELEKQKEKERVALIKKVAENFFDYREVVNGRQKYLSDMSHHVIRNTIRRIPQYPLDDADKVFQDEEERNNVLASHLMLYGKEAHHVKMVRNVIEEYKNAQIKLKSSIEDLKHFYKITKYPTSQTKKVRSLEKVLLAIGDLSPLYDLESACKNIKEFNELHSFRFIEKYLEKDEEGGYVVDKHNIYVVNSDYFVERANKLKNNVRRNLESVQKNIWKLTRNHKTEEQLRRYLTY